MNKPQHAKPDVQSSPTLCLHCHLLVVMTHVADADPIEGSWHCSKCGHQYPFRMWKIKKARVQ